MSDKKTISFLREAVKILTTHKWCRGSYALTSTKDVVLPLDPKAESFCIVGALCKASGHNPIPIAPTKEATKAVMELARTVSIRTDSLSVWNDKHARDKRQVIRAINKTIKRLEAEQ